MKKYIIIITISLLAILSGILICTNLFNNTIQESDVEIQYLKNTVSELENTVESSQLVETEISPEQIQIDELKIKLEVLESKLNNSISDMGTLQNKITEQDQIIASSKNKITASENQISLLQNKVSSLENEIAILNKPVENKLIGIWEGKKKTATYTVDNVTTTDFKKVKYVFKEDGSVDYSIEGNDKILNYICINNMLFSNNSLMFFNLTSENTMEIYYFQTQGGTYYTYTLTRE